MLFFASWEVLRQSGVCRALRQNKEAAALGLLEGHAQQGSRDKDIEVSSCASLLFTLITDTAHVMSVGAQSVLRVTDRNSTRVLTARNKTLSLSVPHTGGDSEGPQLAASHPVTPVFPL